MSFVSKAVRSVKGVIVKDFLNGLLKDAAEGKWGPAPKAAYWWTHDHALWIGGSLAVAHFTLLWLAANGVCAKCSNADYWLVTLAEILAPAGLAIGFHAADAPKVDGR